MTPLKKVAPFSQFRGNAPASEAEIANFEENSGFKMPMGYAMFMRQWNGGEGFIGQNAYVIFWRLNEIADMNKAYQVEEFAPGFLIFGSNGGGEAYAFDTRTPATQIVSIPFVGMEPSVARMIAPTFEGFLDTLSQV